MSVFKIHHITKYEYERPVKESVNEIKIYPLSIPAQQLIDQQIQISNNPEIFEFVDYWGNKTGNFTITQPHQSLSIESKLIIETKPLQLELVPDLVVTNLKYNVQDLQLLQYRTLEIVQQENWLASNVADLYTPDATILSLIFSCNEFIYKNFRYIKGITTIETTVDEIITQQAGVCQDFSHLLLALLRRMHIPARYVSGYICPNKNGMRGEGATHAWVEAYIPSYGWLGVDPTNNCWAGNHHVKLATGRDFKDCTPVKGTFKGASKQALSVYVSVGYEDGVVFEEMNAVQMEKLAVSETTGLFDNFAAQQQ
jgi:transglutaminase-like putative cysteine protease